MCSWLAICALVLTAGQPPIEPPLVGRPPDFSGAVGGPFVVEQTAAPTELTAEEPLTLTVRITGPGNLRDLPRPPLAKLEAYKSFAVDDLDDRFVDGDPPRREFRYRLRPRSADVKAVPRLKFVYFSPHVRRYQTTYGDPVSLTVKPRTPPVPDGPAEVPAWILQEWESRDEEFQLSRFEHWRNEMFLRFGLDPYPERDGPPGPWIAMLALVGPLLICGAWYAIWRHRHPDAARLARQRRSRAGAVALRELRKATAGGAGFVHAVVCEYLRSSAGLPATATTPAEVEGFLRNGGYPADRVAAVVELLRCCDRARFSSEHKMPVQLSTDAERLILELEGAP
jgi:hypothetical protein